MISAAKKRASQQQQAVREYGGLGAAWPAPRSDSKTLLTSSLRQNTQRKSLCSSDRIPRMPPTAHPAYPSSSTHAPSAAAPEVRRLCVWPFALLSERPREGEKRWALRPVGQRACVHERHLVETERLQPGDGDVSVWAKHPLRRVRCAGSRRTSIAVTIMVATVVAVESGRGSGGRLLHAAAARAPCIGGHLHRRTPPLG